MVIFEKHDDSINVNPQLSVVFESSKKLQGSLINMIINSVLKHILELVCLSDTTDQQS